MGEDVLRIRNMQFYGYHGLLPEEARLGQRYEVDVEVFGSFEGLADLGEVPDLEKAPGTVNYPEVFTLTESIVTSERFGLVESLADRIATAIQEQFGVKKLIVRVRKPDPPVAGHFEGVEAEVRRGT